MKPAAFRYHRAEAGDEALLLLAAHGDDAKLIAGGQSLVPLMNLRLAQPAVLVDIAKAPDLVGITLGGELRIGAATRQSDVLRSADVGLHAPLVVAALRHVGHPAIRSRGTFGGSIAHADPVAELPAVAVALDARMVVRGPAGSRVVAAGQFFVTHLTTALEEGELLAEVLVPAPEVAGEVRDVFLEVSRRQGDFALVGVAVRLVLGVDGLVALARIALCGVSDTPVRAQEAERVLLGQDARDAELAREAGRVAARDLAPRSDLQASAIYRREVAEVLVSRAVLAAARGDVR
jgi:carbon-monoxide dehydrogenase medium subunit